jgi:hypothetical protein
VCCRPGFPPLKGVEINGRMTMHKRTQHIMVQIADVKVDATAVVLAAVYRVKCVQWLRWMAATSHPDMARIDAIPISELNVLALVCRPGVTESIVAELTLLSAQPGAHYSLDPDHGMIRVRALCGVCQ